MDGASKPELVHATAVVAEGRAALLLGASGSGKSDLALRVITGVFRHAGRLIAPALVADDQVHLTLRDGRLFASAPATIAGRIEVRGLGIVEVEATAEAEVVLAVELVPPARVERMPDPVPNLQLAGVVVPLLRLAPFEPSAPAKLVLAMLGTRVPP